MLLMFFLCAQKDQYVVNIDNAHDIEKILECVLNKTLKNAWSVSQTKGHNHVLEKSKMCSKCSLPLIAITYPDKVEGVLKVKDHEHLAALDMIKEVVDEREWVLVLLHDGIEPMVIDTKAELTRFLVHKEDR